MGANKRPAFALYYGKYGIYCFEFASFQREKGFKMENGEFSFDSGAELKVGEKLEILISPAAPENLP